MMNDSLHEYHLTRHFEYRHEQLMEEARRERLKADVLRRARQQGRASGWLQATIGTVVALYAGFRRAGALDQPCIVDDCLKSSLTS